VEAHRMADVSESPRLSLATSRYTRTVSLTVFLRLC
jgi:hypothetical protein